MSISKHQEVFNKLVNEALARRAEEVLVETTADEFRVRMRLSGKMFDAAKLPDSLSSGLFSLIRERAGIDIKDRRSIHRGRFTVQKGDSVTVWDVFLTPTRHGDHLTMRIHDSGMELTRESIGLRDKTWKKLLARADSSRGLILVSGGMHADLYRTIYVLLSHFTSLKRKVISLEDSMSYDIPGVLQPLTGTRRHHDMGEAWDEILPHQPDVLFLERLDNRSLMERAIDVSLSGILVIGAVNARDSIHGITRMLRSGVAAEALSEALVAVLGQATVRTVCDSCAEQVLLPDEVSIPGLSVRKAAMGKGCTKCHNTGFGSTMNLFELLVPDDSLRRAIDSGAGMRDLRVSLENSGFEGLQLAARNVLSEGKVPFEEVRWLL